MPVSLHTKTMPPKKATFREECIEIARRIYGAHSDDVQIDPDAKIEQVDEGVWVTAKVFVPNREI
jgi:hypothetical protein